MTLATAEIRPTHWRGVDAGGLPGNECLIDWAYIENIAKDLIELGSSREELHCDIYNLMCEWAIEEREKGNTEGCCWYASHGMAAINYYQTPFEND